MGNIFLHPFGPIQGPWQPW